MLFKYYYKLICLFICLLTNGSFLSGPNAIIKSVLSFFKQVLLNL